MNPAVIRSDEAVSRTVYSAVWPETETETLVRRCMVEVVDTLLARHQQAHTKRQDPMHEEFFEAWNQYAQLAVLLPAWNHRYPTAGSSGAIREILRSAVWQHQDLVVFEGDYEGYAAMARMQGTTIHVVDRRHWREQLDAWRTRGTPWGQQGRRAQWWGSQPSAIDGCLWPDFDAWLMAMDEFEADTALWVDLCYLGVTTRAFQLDLRRLLVAGIVFSLSKAMGAYYRRIGGRLSRDPLPGLWGNGWFKNLDSLYLGTRWLQDPTFQGDPWRSTLCERQALALERALSVHGDAFVQAGVAWRPSDVALLMSADAALRPAGLMGDAERWWNAAARGVSPAWRRLCLTPSLDLEGHHVAS